MTSNGKGLHVQHETEMLARRLIVARAALETISNGECAPEISKTARAAHTGSYDYVMDMSAVASADAALKSNGSVEQPTK